MGNRAAGRWVLGCAALWQGCRPGVKAPANAGWGTPFAGTSSLSSATVALASGERRRAAVTWRFAGTAATHDQVCHELRGCAAVRRTFESERGGRSVMAPSLARLRMLLPQASPLIVLGHMVLATYHENLSSPAVQARSSACC